MPDLWTALDFDYAVLTWGTYVQNELVEGRKLRDILDIPMTTAERREMNQKSLARMNARAADPRSGIKVVK